MTVETENETLRLLQELKAEFKEMRKDIVDIKVTQAEMQGKVSVTPVYIHLYFSGLSPHKSSVIL